MNRVTVGAIAGLALLAGCGQSPTIESEPTTAPIVGEPRPEEASPSAPEPAGPGPTATEPMAEAEYQYGQAASVTISDLDEAANSITMTATVTVDKPEQRTESYGDGPQQVLYFPVSVKATTKFDTSSLTFTYTAPDGLTASATSGMYDTLYPGQVIRGELQVQHEDRTPVVPGGYLQLEGFLDEGRVIWR